MCPAEWTDDFGDEFYEHILENGFYYLTPDDEWRTATSSIPAPGIEQFSVPSTEDLQLSINALTKEMEIYHNGQSNRKDVSGSKTNQPNG